MINNVQQIAIEVANRLSIPKNEMQAVAECVSQFLDEKQYQNAFGTALLLAVHFGTKEDIHSLVAAGVGKLSLNHALWYAISHKKIEHACALIKAGNITHKDEIFGGDASHPRKNLLQLAEEYQLSESECQSLMAVSVVQIAITNAIKTAGGSPIHAAITVGSSSACSAAIVKRPS